MAKKNNHKRPDIRLFEPSFRDKTDQQAYDEMEKKGRVGNVLMAEQPAILGNMKVGRSFDCTTACPRQIRGIGCKYCYVNAAREKGIFLAQGRKKIGGKWVQTACAQTKYNGQIRRWSQKEIDKLNKNYDGLRLFSIGDFIDTQQCRINLDGVIQDAKARGLKLKAVTKVPKFVEDYHNDIDVINVSVDSLGSGMRWKEAKRLYHRYPNVIVRAVALNKQDLKDWINEKDWVKLITPYHGHRIVHAMDLDDPDVKKEYDARKREGEPVKTVTMIENMKPTLTKDQEVVKLLDTHFKNQTCDRSGKKCQYCTARCGSRLVEQRERSNQEVSTESDEPTLRDIKRSLKPIPARFTPVPMRQWVVVQERVR